MKKNKLLVLPLIAAFAVPYFAGCGQNEIKNSAPDIDGVRDMQCLTYSKVDLLDGVAALDDEDGDLTADMEISINPKVETEEGYATFTSAGNYTVSYSVRDKDGETASATSVIEVVERQLFKSFDQPDTFSLTASGQAKIIRGGMVNGEYIIEGGGGNLAEDLSLTREYAMLNDYVYTFYYSIESSVSGRIKATADGKNAGEFVLSEGDNEIAFTHKLTGDKSRAKISLCLGLLEENARITVKSVSCSRPQNEGESVTLADDFDFNGRVIPRIENGNEGNAYATDDKKACLEITKPNGKIWEGGAFINTGVTMKPEQKYIISYKIEAENDENFEVIIQRGQWGAHNFKTNYKPIGEVCETIEVNRDTAGELWLYIQSGEHANKIVLSDLKVTQIYGGREINYIDIADFTEAHPYDKDENDNELYKCTLSTECGGFEYVVENFADKDDKQTVRSQSFYLSGSAKNYVITFRAKATAPIEAIFAGPVTAGWDPSLAWTRFVITEEERLYTVFCGGESADRYHDLVWQFGGESNMKYHNVKIEISDIKISIRHSQLDN